MKVLVVSTVRFRLNGITSVILNYYRNLNKEDMKIDFVVPNEISEDYKKELNSNGSVVYHIPRKKKPFAYQKKLYQILKQNQYDIIHIHGNSAMMLLDVLPAKFAKTEVRIVHSHNTTCNYVWIHKILEPIFKLCYTHGFACGEDAGKWLFGNDDFVLLKNGIELEKYKYDEKIRQIYREKIGATNRKVVGHVGNFIEQKNHEFLIDVFAELVKKDENYLLLLISDGALLNHIKEKVKNLNLDNNVIFLGKCTEVYNYLQAMDLFVLPSLHEGLPVVLIEAQASGLPCFVSDKVSKESDLTNSINFIDISNLKSWIEEINNFFVSDIKKNRMEVSRINQDKISMQGYDVKKNASIMEELFKKYLNENM